MRAIDGDELIKRLNLAIAILKKQNKNIDVEDDVESQMELKAYRDIRDSIKEMPTIEPKKGQWYKPNGVMPPEHFGRHRCSICDAFAIHEWKHHREQLTDYCPNCGAYMRGDEK